jgi:ABC-2 type transport system permease protein
MSNVLNVMFIEYKKARRSKMLLITLLAFLFIPLVGAGFMILMKNPEQAKDLGIINTKAQLIGAVANWEFFLSFFSQAIAIGGTIIFSFIAAWVFGREYIDKKLKDLLATPTSRTAVVIAKFLLITVWCSIFSWLSLAAGIGLGLIIKLPGFNEQLLVDGISRYLVASSMAVLLAWTIAFAANIGRSYFPALAFLVLAVALAQIVAVLGWGEYFPWAIPGLYANVAGPVKLGPASYILVILIGFLGVLGTVLWWRYADHM